MKVKYGEVGMLQTKGPKSMGRDKFGVDWSMIYVEKVLTSACVTHIFRWVDNS